MNGIVSRNVRFCFGLLALVTLGWVLAGQAAKPVKVGRSVPTDWSHRHLIFSHPATPELAGRVAEDPRYWQQLDRDRLRMMMPAGLVERVASGSSAAGSAVRRINRRPRSHGDWSVDLGAGGSVGAGTYPAKYAFHSNLASCSDFVAFSTGLPGAVNQASIVAFSNLYTGGCIGTVPAISWAYNTSSILPPAATTILTSPVLSRDGTQLAFVQTDGPAAQFVLLKWVASTTESVTSPGTPTHVPLAAYRLCVAPCMTTVNLGGHNDLTSSVFINYSGDTAWVGDSAGLLYQFTGVFLGTPAEVGGVFPVAVSTGALGSPVFDNGSQQVFAAGAADGVLYRVDPVTGTKTASGQLDFSGNLAAGPIVDSSLGTVYVSASSDGTTNCAGATPCAAVYQLPTNFTGSTTPSEVAVGTGGATNPMYDGFFDSAYLKSVNGTGNFYVCGNTGAQPTVFQVPINADVFGTPTTVSVLTRTQNQPCSPLIDVNNPNTSGGASERVFVSTAGNAWPNICTGGGCVISFVVTQWQPSTAYAVGQEILVHSPDNPNVLFTYVVTDPGTSGTTTPHWLATPDLEVSDPNNAGIFWLNQGRIDDTPYHPWAANTAFNVVGQRILDGNGNAQLVHTAGTSGGSAPPFGTVPGDITADGLQPGLTWRCAGPVPTAALPAAGGTSGIIIDNVVGSGTMAGASQVYFSTLDDQVCATGGTGSCAVQASQVGLQ